MAVSQLTRTFVLAAAIACLGVRLGAEEKKVDFKKQIEPILSENCFKCHGPDNQESGLRLDRKKGMVKGGERGTPVDLPAGQTIEKVTIGLPRGSVIAGRIVDEFGEPLTGAQVSVLRYAYVNGTRQLRPAGQSDRTDERYVSKCVSKHV